MKIKQLTSYPNPNEIGLGNTNDSYIRVENSLDVSDIFPLNEEVSIIDSKTGKQYIVKAKVERTEFRITKMSQLYRDYNVRPGDEIKFTYIENQNKRAIFFTVTNYKRVFLSVTSKGTEIVNIDNLTVFSQNSQQQEFRIPINEGILLLKFEKSAKKRADSPNETDFFSSLVNDCPISKGNYYISLSDNNNVLEEVKKNVVEEYNLPESLPEAFVPSISDQSLQQIFYGAPGTGKSHKTDEVTSKYPDTVRTTFHPDSDYSTFVGAYKPTTTSVPKYGLNGSNTVPFKDENDKVLMETKIEYKFVKQAFLKAYVKAWKLFKETCVDGGKLAPQFLVIEEINRGNCAQIFGDLFQLLDRKQNFSEYPIEADDDIRKALLEEDTKENPSFGENGLQLTPEQITYVNQVFDKDGEPSRGVAEKICNGQVLVLPPNFYIWATMNTSDQSLFPIDSAFKRRWEWKYVRINEGKDKDKQPLNFRIQFTTLEGEKVDESWWDFIQKINEKIEVATKSEDKKLGYFFCKPDKKANETDKENTIISAETFVGKVVFYLWQDVFKDYGFKSDIFKKEGNARLAFHDFYPHNIEPDEEKNPEGIDLKLVKRFIDKVMDRKPSVASTDTPAAAPTTE